MQNGYTDQSSVGSSQTVNQIFNLVLLNQSQWSQEDIVYDDSGLD